MKCSHPVPDAPPTSVSAGVSTSALASPAGRAPRARDGASPPRRAAAQGAHGCRDECDRSTCAPVRCHRGQRAILHSHRRTRPTAVRCPAAPGTAPCTREGKGTSRLVAGESARRKAQAGVDSRTCSRCEGGRSSSSIQTTDGCSRQARGGSDSGARMWRRAGSVVSRRSDLLRCRCGTQPRRRSRFRVRSKPAISAARNGSPRMPQVARTSCPVRPRADCRFGGPRARVRALRFDDSRVLLTLRARAPRALLHQVRSRSAPPSRQSAAGRPLCNRRGCDRRWRRDAGPAATAGWARPRTR